MAKGCNSYLEVSEFLSPDEVDRVVGEALLVEVEGPPGAGGGHPALALKRPRLVRPQLGVEGGVDAAHWERRMRGVQSDSKLLVLKGDPSTGLDVLPPTLQLQ